MIVLFKFQAETSAVTGPGIQSDTQDSVGATSVDDTAQVMVESEVRI